MRKSLLQLLFCLLLAPASLLAQTHDDLRSSRQVFQLPDGMTAADYWPGKVIFKVREDLRPFCSASRIDIPAFSRYLDGIGATALRLSFPNADRPSERVNALGQPLADLSLIYELEYAAAADIENAVNLLLETGLVSYAEPSYIYKPFFDPDDPDTTGQYYLNLIHAREAWDLDHGDSSIVIGIIDTGTSFTHPDLAQKIQHNYADPIDGLDNDGNGYLDDYQGWDFGGAWHSLGDNNPQWVGSAAGSDHGVLVGGAAACATDNGINVAALGFNCRILPVKVSIDETPLIYYGYQGIVYAADMGVQIMNLSWGGGDSECRMCAEAIQYATINKDVLVVAAAGNTPGVINFYPASYPLVLSVPGTQQNDSFWLSNPNFGTTRSYFTDVSAPSRDILTTTTDAGLYSATGTSLGAPITCGVAGLVRSHFPALNNQQVGQMVRMGSDPAIYSLNTGIYTEQMGHGRVDALGALTYAGPSVRAVEVDYDPGPDGLIQAGDTVLVRVRLANYLAAVQNLQVDLTSPSFAQIAILHGNVGIGSLGMLDTASNWMAPFKIRINPTAAAGTLTYLRFGYAGTNYVDYEYFPLKVQPTYINVDANRLETSMDGKGRWGATNFPSLSNGVGLMVDQSGIMNDAGFMVGKDAGHVSNNFENQAGSADNHFTNLVPISRTLGGQVADLEAYTRYSDAGAGANAIGVIVDQHTYQWNMASDNNYIIQEYTLHNPTSSPMNGLYAGMYYDIDGFWRGNNVSQYDPISRTIYDSTETFVMLWNVGVSLLTPDSLRGYACSTATWGYAQADKWTALTSAPQNAVLRNTNVAQFTGAGPFNIAPGDSHIVAFAILAGDSLAHLRTSRQAAYDKYWCVVRGGMSPQVDLGPDILNCGSTAPVTLNAGAGQNSYQWSTGSTTQSISVGTGDYWVKTSDVNGCLDYDRIKVTLNPGLSAAFSANAGPYFVGDTITFISTTPGSMEWGWDFGDGSNLCPINDTVKHAFAAPGSYQVCLGVGNCVCYDTICLTITIDTLVGSLDPTRLGQLQAYPVPATDRLQIRLADEALGTVSLALYDIAGRNLRDWVLEKNGNTLNAVLDVSDLPAGMYMLRVRDAIGSYTQRILVE
jgi:serine protease